MRHTFYSTRAYPHNVVLRGFIRRREVVNKRVYDAVFAADEETAVDERIPRFQSVDQLYRRILNVRHADEHFELKTKAHIRARCSQFHLNLNGAIMYFFGMSATISKVPNILKIRFNGILSNSKWGIGKVLGIPLQHDISELYGRSPMFFYAQVHNICATP